MTKTSWLEDACVKAWFEELGNARSIRDYFRGSPTFLEYVEGSF